MNHAQLPIGSHVRIDKRELQALVDALKQDGYRTIMPRASDGAIIYDDVDQIDELPIGQVDIQDGGYYRLIEDAEAGYFDYVVGPHSLKQYLFPASETVLEGQKTGGVWRLTAPSPAAERIAVIGIRSCDLHAMAIQDRVFLEGPYVDEGYKARREALFAVAVNCRRASATCFCHSMQTGPAVGHGFDLALTERDDHFVVEIGSQSGAGVVARIDAALCDAQEIDDARSVPRQLEQAMHAGQHQDERALREGLDIRRSHAGVLDDSPPLPRSPQAAAADIAIRPRRLDTTDIRDLLVGNLEHPRWDEVAERCLACGNCTMVCPTCFCSSVEDVSDLTGERVRRERSWASCFMSEHSQMSSGVVRGSTRSRYRQWLVHKLATWIDQFDVSGCVGCGRCITWCPVGIDLTEEVAAIRGVAP